MDQGMRRKPFFLPRLQTEHAFISAIPQNTFSFLCFPHKWKIKTLKKIKLSGGGAITLGNMVIYYSWIWFSLHVCILLCFEKKKLNKNKMRQFGLLTVFSTDEGLGSPHRLYLEGQ